jgi:hypothetical protein
VAGDPGRRRFLQGLGAIAVLSTAGANTVSAAEGPPPLRWPKPIGSPVLESLRPVIVGSRHVRTDVRKIEEVASWMAYEDLPMPQLGLPFGMEKNLDQAIDFILVADVVDFAFTDFSTQVKFQVDYDGKHTSDSEALFACMKRALDEGIPLLEGRYLARVTKADLQHIFRGNIEMPMLEERVEMFHQVGQVLEKDYGGHFYHFVRECSPRLYDNGKGLIEKMVAVFPRFNDTSRYDGHTIKIYKLAQLGIWMLYAPLHATGGFRLEDPEKMTAFADYIVPVALRVMGITSYSPVLERAINTHQMIARDSVEEIEIRAHCLYATALLSEEVNKLRPPDRQVIIPQIDARLWTHYHTTSWPHHLTRTIMY